MSNEAISYIYMVTYLLLRCLAGVRNSRSDGYCTSNSSGDGDRKVKLPKRVKLELYFGKFSPLTQSLSLTSISEWLRLGKTSRTVLIAARRHRPNLGTL